MSRFALHTRVTHSYTKTYEKFDSYVEASAHGVRSDNTERPSDSTSTYDVNGNLIKGTETKWPADNPEASSAGVMERIFSNDANDIELKKVIGDSVKKLPGRFN